jgi:hypothetical protein
MRYVRIYNDGDGESHFEDLDLALAPVDYAPPATPFDVSDPFPASRAVLFSVPAGWFGDWHPTPRRQLYFALSGQLEIGVTDGEVRVFVPGDVAVVEDEVGRGHTTKPVAGAGATGAFVHLADEV